MRVAWFTHRYFPCIGGAENYGRAIVRRLASHGHEVDVLTSNAHDLWYFTNPNREPIDAPAESMVDGARVRRFPVAHFPGQRYVGRLLSYLPSWSVQCRFESYMPLIPGLGRIHERYDAVFAVGFPYTVFSHAAYRVAKRSGAPLILTPFLHLATPGDPVNRHYTRPHQIRLLKESDCVVVQTSLEADAVRNWGIAPSKILTLGMGVEHRDVTGGVRNRYREAFGIPANAPVVGHLATLDPNKGSNDLVLAVARLNEKRPANDPIHLIMAGPTSPCFERFLTEQPTASWPWLHLHGPMALDDRADFFAALDVFSMPSRTDSFGIVYLEAWANGLPVVAAAAGGVPDVVKDGEAGHLVPFGDLDALSGAIGRLLDDEEIRRRFGTRGREMVARGYTWDDRYRTLMSHVEGLTVTAALPGHSFLKGMHDRPLDFATRNNDC